MRDADGQTRPEAASHLHHRKWRAQLSRKYLALSGRKYLALSGRKYLALSGRKYLALSGRKPPSAKQPLAPEAEVKPTLAAVRCHARSMDHTCERPDVKACQASAGMGTGSLGGNAPVELSPSAKPEAALE
jgi:hypothetical protein